MSKGRAFVVGLVLIVFVFITCVALLLHKKIDASLVPISGVLTAIVALTSGYIGLQVANNGVKGKFFNEGLVEDRPDQNK